jgi:NAD(P)-dependent dehydrogenase (short-subunit alcohol dehydrogenase family)
MTESTIVHSARKNVLVTGAARGVGRASAVAFARAGYNVAGADIAAPVSDILDFEPATRADLDETGRQVDAAGARWPRACPRRQRQHHRMSTTRCRAVIPAVAGSVNSHSRS